MARAQPGTSKAPTTKIRARRSSLSALIAAPTWAKRVHCLLHRFRSHFKRLTCSPLCASSGLKHRLLHRHPFLVKRNQLLLGEKPLPIHAVIISYTLSLHFLGLITPLFFFAMPLFATHRSHQFRHPLRHPRIVPAAFCMLELVDVICHTSIVD